jgi:hypothetical protein
MRLASTDGAVVDLAPVRYQYPEMVPTESPDWDCNWLMIHGDIRLADGRCWWFEDPCLTTWDTKDVARWLRRVRRGLVRPAPLAGEETKGLREFIEPNLALSLAARDRRSRTIRFHFSAESRPRWMVVPPDADEDFDLSFSHAQVVEVTVSLVDLARAIDEWTAECARFPER